MAAGDEMRVSDAEREAAAAELQEHFASGRLDQEELNERLAAAFAAKTRGELNALFNDLPSSGHGWSDAGSTGTGSFRPDDAEPSLGQRARSDLGALLVLVPAIAVFGVVSLLALGHGKPLGFVFILAAFALLRRLLFVIFGRRKRGGSRGPRRAPHRRH